jgi:hypothetical protein
MIRPWLFLALLFLAAPALAQTPALQEIPVQDIPPPAATQDGQNVEEPDAPDENPDMSPPEEVTPPPKEKPAPVPEAPKPAEPNTETGDTNFDRVVLQGLNKVTARAVEIEAPIGSAVRFGTIEIVAHRCWKSAPDERPENAALLEIFEIKQGEAPAKIFMGWMFSSSPALSALEHPFYDVTVVKCEKPAALAPAPAKQPAKKKR